MKYANFGDLVKIAVISYAFIWGFNRALTVGGLGGFVARPNPPTDAGS